LIGVLNTRPHELAPELSAKLRAAGYEPFEAALVELSLDPSGLEGLRARAQEVEAHATDYTGILISSPNLLSALAEAGEKIPKVFLRKPWYLISARIRAQVEALGARIAFIPQEASVEGFIREIATHNGARLLHLCSSQTRLKPESLKAKGFVIENLTLYTPGTPQDSAEAIQAAWNKVRAVIFASGTAVHHLFNAQPALAAKMGTPSGPLPISIGLSATEALKANGIRNYRQAPTADNAGFIAALNLEFRSP
jgi:uroporphyrinogen-III synthase